MIELRSNNCEERIVVFSENTATLQYLFTLLKEYKFPVTLCIHGKEERAIRLFKRTSKILLATDSFAQSYDIPFCSCVINYDVPWSIQKLERRIACCHTYSQQHDVLVFYCIDPTNRADRRLYTVVNKKLKQFDAVFGVSETILGETVTDIYSLIGEVRSLEDIQEEQEAFIKRYQKDIANDSSCAGNDLLAHFDEE